MREVIVEIIETPPTPTVIASRSEPTRNVISFSSKNVNGET
jgi:hypothetical protein